MPLIKDYFQSEENETKQPGSNVLSQENLPYALNNVKLTEKHGPFDLKKKMFETSDSLIDLTPQELNLQFKIKAYKYGEHVITGNNERTNDIWLMQFTGTSQVRVEQKLKEIKFYSLEQKDSIFISRKNFEQIVIKNEKETDCVITFEQYKG